MQNAAFLDRDGTIIEDVGYLDECNKVRFLPRVSEAIKLLNGNGFKVIIATNQSGVARGYFSEARVKEINRYVQETLAGLGAFIDKVYFCPHHTEGIIEEYRKDCHCRKPNTGMIEEAVREFDIDLENSFLIGDKISDIEAGHRAGCRTILVGIEGRQSNENEIALMADYVAQDLYEAVNWLVKLSGERG